MSNTTVKAIIDLFEQWVPLHYAESWDNVGLLVGDRTMQVDKLMITLDVTEEVVDEALKNNVNMIIAHHPLIFEGLKAINLTNFKGKIIQKLIKHDIAVYAAHTNLDIVSGGVNDLLAEKIGLENSKVLHPMIEEKLYKLVIYVPSSHTDVIVEELGESGAGFIGNYSHCTFRTNGTGTFKPLEGTNPYIGKAGFVERVAEDKIETLVKESQLHTIISKIESVHPYEEMAYDVFQLKNTGTSLGLGRIGTLNQSCTLDELLEIVKKAFHVNSVRFVGDRNTTITTVAILGGSGKSYINDAIKKGADCFITGDLSFHEAQDALAQGITLIDPGHHIEEVMKEGVKKYFEDKMAILPSTIQVITSELSTDPFQYS